MIKRILKWLAIIVLVVLAIPILAILGTWGYHRSIVTAGPGTLAGAPEPVGRCAQADPFNATGGFPWMSGLNAVAACTPLGMVRLGPDTAPWLDIGRPMNRSGYYYGSNRIIGFSHNRLVGADASEGGAFRVFPTLGSSIEEARRPERYVKFSHARERAFPGYYGVHLQSGIVAEMTATPRAGVHRYRFPEGSDAVMLIDAASALGGGRCENVTATIDPATGELSGSMRTFGSFSGRYGGLNVYFAARVNTSIRSCGTFSGDVYTGGKTDLTGPGLLELHFAQGSTVELRLALSYVSIENARENLAAETGGKNFDVLVLEAQEAWNDIFGRIEVEGGTAEQQRIFYTALMRAFTMPTTFSDVNGEYLGFDQQVHTAEDFTYYTDFSIWDTFRTVHPLYTLIAPERHTDMLRSLEMMVKQGGALPRWPSGAGYTNCMFGSPADLLVSEAYLKGLRDFDAEAVYAAARAVALEGVPEGSRFGGRQGLDAYLQYGYCPADKVHESVACTIDYAWCDGSLALWAEALGKPEDAAVFAQHAQSYKQIWNPQTLFFQARNSDGSFRPELSPLTLTYTDFDHKYTEAYVEGSAMQWRWGSLFDADGLVGLWPSKDKFVSALTDYMDGTRSTIGWWHPGGNYWHGNEPFIHAPYLFNAADRPDLTQHYVRRILETKYSDDYVGLDGNDDGGTLSAWYVFSALGFYPVAGSTRYELGAPLFTRATVQLGGGKRLTIDAPGNSDNTIYAAQTTLNGTALNTTHFSHEAIANGGTLTFTMQETPK
ncbi:MAG: hypothetical protein GC168_20705 [Candidatus Hydrogenedens sp.]|nr:hypothetical protein [Candidatus Hydrogenedens sp.]